MAIVQCAAAQVENRAKSGEWGVPSCHSESEWRRASEEKSSSKTLSQLFNRVLMCTDKPGLNKTVSHKLTLEGAAGYNINKSCKIYVPGKFIHQNM